MLGGGWDKPDFISLVGGILMAGGEIRSIHGFMLAIRLRNTTLYQEGHLQEQLLNSVPKRACSRLEMCSGFSLSEFSKK